MTDDIPGGTVADIVEWVGDDPARAQTALDAEYEGQARTTLIAKLEAILDPQEDSTVTESNEAPAEQIDPASPGDIVLDATSADVTVSVVHRRDVDVEVPEYDDIAQMETIEADPVEYFQLAGSPTGAVFSFNGGVYSLRPDQVAAFKGALDKVLIGLTL
jgi:hypothetical protein